MADKKDELGVDLDKMEDFDFDFDTDFGGDFFAEEPPPANKREAVSRSLKAAGKSFAEEFDPRDPEKIEKFIESAIPSSLSTEFNSLIDLKESVTKELEKTGPEIKRNTNKLLKTINRYMPKGKISGGLDKLIGMTESQKAYSALNDQKSKEAALEESISKMIEMTMAKDERDNAEARIREEIAYRKDLNQLEISNHIVANLDRLINFEHTVTSNYYKKSLDLQYRLLDTVTQTLELNKIVADTNKNQLESVIKNTSLPDVVKVRSAEVVKMLALQNTANSAMKNLFGEGSRASRVKDRLVGVAKNKIGSLTYGLQSANMGIDMAESMKEQSQAMGQSNMGASMGGSMIGGAARDMLGDITGRYLEKNEKAANKIADIKEFFSNPQGWFKEKLDESYSKEKDPSFLERRKRDFLSTMAEATNSSLRDGYISIEKADLDASAIYTNRTNDSITKTIPRLLSEILYNTAGTNLTLQQHTGITPNVDKLRLDSTTGKLISEKASLIKIKDRFEDEARSGGGAYNIRRATGTFLENGKMNLSEKERAELDRAVSEYLMEGGKVTSEMFKDKKLLAKLKDKKLIKRVFRAEDDFSTRGSRLDRAKSKTDFNNYIDGALTSIKSPDQLFSKMIREGNLDQLEEIGLIKLTEDGTPVVDNKRYKELISGAFYKESLKYAENDTYKNKWDRQSDLDKLSKAKAKERIDALKNKATEIKDNTLDTANKFKSDLKDGTIEKKIEEMLSKDNIKNKASILNSKASDFKANTIKSATDKLNILEDEINKILLTEENKEKLDEAKARIQEAKDIIDNSNISKKVKANVNKYNVNETLDKAKTFTDSVVDTLKNEISNNSPKDLVKSIITVDAAGTAVIERLENEAFKKIPKEDLIETKLEMLVDAIEENTDTTKESNKLSKDELKAGKTTKFNDLNNDGVRDGSFREKMGKVFRTGPKEVEKKKEESKEDKSSSMFKTILSSLFGGFTSLAGGLFSGLTGMFGGLTSLIGGIGGKIIGPLIGGLSSLIPGALKGGVRLAGKMLKGGAKGVGKFVKATGKTRGMERKLFGSLLNKAGGAALRKVPLVGLLAGGYMGYNMIKEGDTIGGLGTMVSSLLAQIPGIGTALSLGVDGLLMLDRGEKKKETDIEVELEKKKQELEERNSMMQKANENNWEKEAVMLQNKFDKYTAEQDLVKNKISELENGKFKSDSRDKLLEKEKARLAESEKKLKEAKDLQVKLNSGSESLKNMRIKREKFLELSKDKNLPIESRDKFKAEADKLDSQIATQENKNAEMKKLIDSQNKLDNTVNSIGDPKKRLDYAIKGKEQMEKQLKNSKDPVVIKAMTEAIARQDDLINKIRDEVFDPSMTDANNAALNRGNKRYDLEQDIKNNPNSYTKTHASGIETGILSPDEAEAEQQRSILEKRIAELEQRKIRVNEAAKKQNGNTGTGYAPGSAAYYRSMSKNPNRQDGVSYAKKYYSSGANGGFKPYNPKFSIADEATIAKNSYKGGDVKKIIDSAAAKAGIDSKLMQVMAAKESSFRVDAKAPTSSALGLYQFLNGTWKETVNKYGSKYDLNMGNASRLNPEHSALMAAEYLKTNMKYIKGTKSKLNITDAYLTHFLGPGGAKKFLAANPNESADRVIGKAAVNANPGIFITNGRIKTVKEAYDTIASQLAKTAGQFGIVINESDVRSVDGAIKEKAMTPSEEMALSNMTGPNTPATPRSNTELAGMSGLTGGHSAAANNTAVSPVNNSNASASVPKDLKESIYNNGVEKIATDEKDRQSKLAAAQSELDKRQASYSNPQQQLNSINPSNNINDSSFKSMIVSTNSLAKASVESIARLDSIVKNTSDTVAVLQKIHDKLDNLGSGNQQAKPTNQSSDLTTIAPENAVSGKRGMSIRQ